MHHDSTIRFAEKLMRDHALIRSVGIDGAALVAVQHDGRKRRLICDSVEQASREEFRVAQFLSSRALTALWARWTHRHAVDNRLPVVVTVAERRRIEAEETHGDPDRARSLRRLLGAKVAQAGRDGRPVHYEGTMQERPALAVAAE